MCECGSVGVLSVVDAVIVELRGDIGLLCPIRCMNSIAIRLGIDGNGTMTTRMLDHESFDTPACQ